MAEESPVNVVLRAMDVLLAVSAEGPSSLAVICAKANVSKATGHRLLRSMSLRQLIVQDPDSGMYALGPGALSIADALSRGRDGVGIIARPVLERIRDASGETVSVHTRVGALRVCVAEVPSPEPLRFTTGVGSSEPLNSGSAGKVLLAFLPDDERRALARGTSSFSDRAVSDWAILDAELNLDAKRGYAIGIGEKIPGVAGVSVPIFDDNRRVFAALNISGPDGRLTLASIESLIPLMQAGAQEISLLINASQMTDAPQEEAS